MIVLTEFVRGLKVRLFTRHNGTVSARSNGHTVRLLSTGWVQLARFDEMIQAIVHAFYSRDVMVSSMVRSMLMMRVDGFGRVVNVIPCIVDDLSEPIVTPEHTKLETTNGSVHSQGCDTNPAILRVTSAT
jgi:hypothetical protein